MDKCDNCVADATFLNRPSPIDVQFFCDQHIPWFLKSRAISGSLERANQVEVVEEAPVAAPKATKKKKAAAPVEQQDTENTDEAGAPSADNVDETGTVSS